MLGDPNASAVALIGVGLLVCGAALLWPHKVTVTWSDTSFVFIAER
jgi:hypothetical protein